MFVKKNDRLLLVFCLAFVCVGVCGAFSRVLYKSDS